MAVAHENLSKEARLAFTKHKLGRLLKNDNGKIKGENRWQVYGLGDGTPDNVGFTRKGQAVGVEIKIPPDDLSQSQIIARNIMLKNNCLHYVIYCMADIDRMVEDVKRRLEE